MFFHFKAQKVSGEIYEGEKEAADKFALFDAIKKEGGTMLFAREVGSGKKFFEWRKLYSRFAVGSIPIHEKIIFAKNLGAMIDAGLPLSRALAVLERQMRNPGMKKILPGVNESIKKGMSLSDSLAKYPSVFSALFISMVKSGEEGGSLSGALRLITNQLERVYYIRRKLRGALMYPAVVVSLIVIVAVVMFVVVIPKLTATFVDLKVSLPWSTQLLVFLSAFLRDHYIVAILGAFLAGVGFWLFYKTPKGRSLCDWAFIKVPAIGPMVVETNAARAARTLSSLLASGVNVVDAIEITKEVVQNVHFKSVLDKAKTAIQKGAPISAPFSENEKIYPAFFSEMVAAGEETGNLSGMLGDVAKFYENEVDEKTKDFSTIIEPIIMIVLGVAVGFFALAMLTPMYSMMGSIQ